MQKLFRLPDGGLIAFAGDLAYGRSLVRHMAGDAEAPRKTPADADNTSALYVDAKGDPFIIAGESLDPSPIEHDFWAIGSGRDFAIAALALGLSAKEAVELACRFDVYSGEGVYVMQPGVGE